MSKYLKLFETTSQYNEYINGSDVVLPNVSVAKDAPKTVYFNPWVAPMNIITYKATAKLEETTDQYSSGLHPNAFSGKSGQLAITSHTFENGAGTIEFDGDVTSIGSDAFYGCSSLTSITIPNSVTSIGDTAFYECRSLTSVTIPNSVTSIGRDAFYNCSGLKKVIVPDIAAWCNISFGSYDANPLLYAEHIFSDENTEIKDLVIPNSVTSIGDTAFYDCSGLKSITIPNSVTAIGSYAFAFCSGLTSITSLATTAPTIQSNTFKNIKTGGTLTVPSGSSDYNVWMGTGDNYLGKYGWTKIEQ